MGQAEREEFDYRPTVDHRHPNVDLLLEALIREHGEPRCDIQPGLPKSKKGKLWEPRS